MMDYIELDRVPEYHRAGGGRKLAEWPVWRAALERDGVAALDITKWCLGHYATLLNARGALNRGAKRERLRMFIQSDRMIIASASSGKRSRKASKRG